MSVHLQFYVAEISNSWTLQAQITQIRTTVYLWSYTVQIANTPTKQTNK